MIEWIEQDLHLLWLSTPDPILHHSLKFHLTPFSLATNHGFINTIKVSFHFSYISYLNVLIY